MAMINVHCDIPFKHVFNALCFFFNVITLVAEQWVRTNCNTVNTRINGVWQLDWQYCIFFEIELFEKFTKEIVKRTTCHIDWDIICYIKQPLNTFWTKNVKYFVTLISFLIHYLRFNIEELLIYFMHYLKPILTILWR